MKSIFSKNGVSLERLMSLERVVRAGSIATASHGDPNVQTLCSRQIGELETVLGLALLDRTKKPYPPTAAARRLADACGRFVREVQEISDAAQGLQQPFTVGAGELTIREFLIPKIGRQTKSQSLVSWVMRNLTRRQIQEDLATERLDIGLASGLETTSSVTVEDLQSYGMKLLLPEGEKPNKHGWHRLKDLPVVLMEGDSSFRRFLGEFEFARGANLQIGAECTTYHQAVDMAENSGWAVFVPEFWWKRREDWAARTQLLPGLDGPNRFQRTMKIGWNRKVAERRPEVARLVDAMKSNGKRPAR